MYRDVAFLPKNIYLVKPINGEFKDSSTVCIEIKAKQGYLMDDDDTSTAGAKKCRFCYFQVKLFFFYIPSTFIKVCYYSI